MEEVIQYIKTNTQDVEGKQMVPYQVALEGLRMITDTLSIELIEKSLTDIYSELEKIYQQDIDERSEF